MMERIGKIVIGVLCFLCVGCNKPKQGEKMQEPTAKPLLSEENTPAPQETLSKPVTNTAVTLSAGKKLESLVKVGEDGPYYCNLEENLTRVFLRTPEEYPVLVCKDPVYEITYYVNYGRDYYIYAKRNGKTECAVKIPARDLYCREGVLYFRTEAYGTYEFDSFENGAVLAYRPEIGSVEVVLDVPVYDMAVYPDGIMYEVKRYNVEEDGTVNEKSFQKIKHFYSFESGESTELGATLHTLARWKDYRMVMEFVKDEEKTKTVYHLETPEGTSAGGLPNLTEILESHRIRKSDLCVLEGYHIMGDFIYYIDKETESLMRYDMVMGIEETVVEIAMPSLYARTFIIHDGNIYFSNGIRYSIGENKQYKTKLLEKTNGLIQGFYTDGEELYILVDGILWLYEERKVSSYGMVSSLVAGRSFMAGCYEAQLYPLGE